MGFEQKSSKLREIYGMHAHMMWGGGGIVHGAEDSSALYTEISQRESAASIILAQSPLLHTK